MKKYKLMTSLAQKRELNEVASEVLHCFSEFSDGEPCLVLNDERLEKPRWYVFKNSEIIQLNQSPDLKNCYNPNITETWVDDNAVYLSNTGGVIGCIGNLKISDDQMEEASLFAGAAAAAIDNALEHYLKDRQISNLNIYLTISNTLHFSMELREQLAYIINMCMDALKAEAASVLLLSDDQKMLEFYAVEGEKSEALSKFVLPVEQGIAGWVIREGQSIIVNDAKNDERFFRKVDSDTGFITNSILAVPMLAGEEKVGVIEVINKLDGEFTREDLNLLCDIAEEAAFAVKNSKMFEYVANTYCKIRQGVGSCRGCIRPLKSWTPCQRDRVFE